MLSHAEALDLAKRLDPVLIGKVRAAVEMAFKQGVSFDVFARSVADLINDERDEYGRYKELN